MKYRLPAPTSRGSDALYVSEKPHPVHLGPGGSALAKTPGLRTASAQRWGDGRKTELVLRGDRVPVLQDTKSPGDGGGAGWGIT